ncbi:MAG: FAD-binding protein, partial [Paludibacteraceae bacterium]|nr:FAD-binding protein [Paludibacteraceae bacterium]
HIGSDKLPRIIQNMRECILAHGGEIHFETKIESLSPLTVNHSPLILAIGHSAHDTYRMLDREGVALEAKGFALGVRAEHPQALINKLFYHNLPQEVVDLLGNASYSLVTQVNGRGVYSFCMCPGGHIVPAGSDSNGCVVNGMSASHRNSPFANSGMVVELHPMGSAMEALDFQEHIERLAKEHGGPNQQAPAQRMKDFVEGRFSTSLPACSYLPGLVSSRLDEWLPEPIGSSLRQGFKDFDRKYKGFLTNDAVVVGVESRSSSPVRIMRDIETMQSVSHDWLYPCGEGAGYAGGITSSALDGINAALKIAERYGKLL